MKKFFSSALDRMKRNPALCAVVLVHILFLSFFLFYNFNTGLFVDDYGYMYNFSRQEKLIDDRVDTIGEVFTSQYEHYFIMNGRSMSHSMLQFALMLGKTAFNFINTFFYFALSFGMYQLVRCRREHSALLQIIMYLVPWIVFPEFGKVFLVCCLSANYLWTLAVIVSVLLPFRKLYDGYDCFEKHSLIGAALMLAAGIFAGWQSENGSAAMLFIVGCMGLYFLIAKKRIPAWCITGFVGMCVGFAMMILAPGYAVRRSGYGSSNIIHQFLKISVYHILPYFGYILITALCLLVLFYSRMNADNRGAKIKFASICAAGGLLSEVACRLLPDSIESEGRLGILFLVVAACIVFAVRCAKSGCGIADLAVPTAFMLTGFVATYTMIVSPTVDTRSEIQFVVFFTCGAAQIIMNFISELSQLVKFDKLGAVVFAAASLFAIVSLSVTAVNIDASHEQFLAREQYIAQQKAAGITDITVEAYDIPDDTHIGMFNMISNDPEYWINKGTCWYYDIDSIQYLAE